MKLEYWLALSGALAALITAAMRNSQDPRLVRIMLLRSAVGAGMLGAGLWIGIGGGVFSGRPIPDRELLGVVMMLSLLGGGLLIGSITWLKRGDGPLPLRALSWSWLAVMAILLLVELSGHLERRYGIYPGRPVLLALGLVIAALTLIRPWWFWEHPKATLVRGLVGDGMTMVLYLGVGCAMIWFAAIPRWAPQRPEGSGPNGFKGTLGQCVALRQGPVDSLGLHAEIAWQSGFETGIALWLPRSPEPRFGWTTGPLPPPPKDTVWFTAYDGHWFLLPGDSIEMRFTRDDHDGIAKVVVAPGPFPRAVRIEADLATFGDSTRAGLVVLETLADSIHCAVEIR